MWLTSSSIGRKFVMALTGICLVLFVTFHVLMNAVALIWPTAYNAVCEFLGANWYALIASAGLALLFIIHIIYACWLTIQNRKARGGDRYAVTSRPPQVEWSSKNMLVLGIVILAFLVVHMIQFWAKMQLVELRHDELAVLPQLNGVPAPPAMGTLMIQMAFSQWWTPVVYIIGFIALWFHMNHGVWSMFHTVGWDNNTWLPRLKAIACWWTSIVVLLFIAQAIVFTVHAHNNFYTEDAALQSQYAEYWDEYAGELNQKYQSGLSTQLAPLQTQYLDLQKRLETAPAAETTAIREQLLELNKQAREEVNKYVQQNGPAFADNAQTIESLMKNQFPKASIGDNIRNMLQTAGQIEQQIGKPHIQRN